MSSNVPEGWNEVERLGGIACYAGWDEFDAYLDALPECDVGLCYKRPEQSIQQQNEEPTRSAAPSALGKVVTKSGLRLLAEEIRRAVLPFEPKDKPETTNEQNQ